MSNVALTRPTARTAGAVITGSKIGTAGTDFYIKVMESDLNFRFPEEETSGDGDTAPAWDSNYWMYLDLTLIGTMPAQSVATFPLANFIDSTKNPILSSNCKLWFSDAQVLTLVRALITGCRLKYRRSGATVPMAIRIRATDSHPTWSTT